MNMVPSPPPPPPPHPLPLKKWEERKDNIIGFMNQKLVRCTIFSKSYEGIGKQNQASTKNLKKKLDEKSRRKIWSK